MTFSIAAWDPESNPPEWGVAVASKFLAVGSAVPWVRAGAGAVATQAWANLAYGPDGLKLLASGSAASEVVDRLTAADEGSAHRQLGVVDGEGRAATFTGDECLEWAGGVTGQGYCCQGNILTGPEVVADMARAFESATGELAQRLLAALEAGDAAGGDRRGKQSAALYVVREGGGYLGGIDRSVDLRVEDAPEPVAELKRLFELHRLYFPRPEDLEFFDLTPELTEEVAGLLDRLGYPTAGSGSFEGPLRDALWDYVDKENLEERWSDEPRIERGILEHLRGTTP